MDAESAREFVRTNHRAILATYRHDGRPQMSPVAAAVALDGRLVISSRETAMKTHNLERDPHASLCVFTDNFFGRWIQVDGQVEIVRLPEAMDLLIEYYRAASGEHDDWDDYRAAMERERRVTLLLSIDSAGPDRQG